MDHSDGPYFAKALESLAGAESELADSRYNNAANRAYYAAFQAAIHALTTVGEQRDTWGHDFVQSQFAAQFIRRRKVLPSDLRGVLPELAIIRATADYAPVGASASQARRAILQSKRLVEFVGKIGP